VKQTVSEKDILNLLSNLKNMGGSYPSDMIQSRRDVYIKQAAAMAVLSKTSGNGNGGGTSAGGGSGMTASGGASAGIGTLSLGTFLETALVVAIAVEAGVAAYIYRDKIADFINSNTSPKVEVVVNPTDDYSSVPAVIPVTGEVTAIETPTDTPTVSVTETSTPPIPIIEAAPQNGNNTSSSDIQEAGSTPAPTDNPGNHFGNTPKPERTKDTSNNSNNSKQTDDKLKD